MEILATVVQQFPAREFASSQDGQNKTVKCVELKLCDGLNTYIVSAFAERAQSLIDHPIKEGSFVRANLSFSVRNAKSNDGKEWMFQQVRLDGISTIFAA